MKGQTPMTIPVPSRRRLLAAGLLTAVLTALGGGAATAQVPEAPPLPTLPEAPAPPLPVAPGLPQPFPASSTASGGTVAEDLALEVLTTATMDPTALAVTPDGRVVFADRCGAIKVITADGATVEAGRILVAGIGCPLSPEPTFDEGGLHGLEVSPDFAEDRKLFIYYSVPFSLGTSGFAANEGMFRLSTVELGDDNLIDPASEVEILRNPAEWANCCHYGGDLDFMPDGTLLLTVGDDTSPRMASPVPGGGYNPRDPRPGTNLAFNAERTSQNPADRRGKVLRLMPDGSVPDGSQAGVEPNPHVDDPAYDPYVYAMGFRSNYRLAVDEATDVLFVANVGPDESADDPARGPRGFDEIETVPAGGGTNHGWPRCVGDNTPYRDFDYVTLTSGEPLSCEGMVPATIWYPYDDSEFEGIEPGGRTAIAGVVYRHDGEGELALPDAYQGKFFFMEWSRDLIWTVEVDDDPESATYGQLDTDTIATVATGLYHPVDATVGPDGAIYVAEYGRGFYDNANSRIIRIVPAEAAAAAPLSASLVGDPATTWWAIPAAVALLALMVGVARRRVTV